jgi:hypothetical protein
MALRLMRPQLPNRILFLRGDYSSEAEKLALCYRIWLSSHFRVDGIQSISTASSIERKSKILARDGEKGRQA